MGPSFNTTYTVVRLRYNRAEMVQLLATTYQTNIMKTGLRLNISFSLGQRLEQGGYARASYDCALSRALRREPNTTDADKAPWLPADYKFTGNPCIGYENRTTKVGDYCGHWDINVNEDAMPGGTYNTSQPFCYVRNDPLNPAALTKSIGPRSHRNTRAGQWELNHWKLVDYCDKYNLFRVMHGGDSVDNITRCQMHVQNITFACMNTDCHQCNMQCTIPALKGGGAFGATIANEHNCTGAQHRYGAFVAVRP